MHVRVLLCDDHRMFVEPLAAALRARGHDVLVTVTPTQAVEEAPRYGPDLVVLDLVFPGVSGLAAVVKLRARAAGCPVVVLSASADPRHESSALAAGAAAFLSKHQPIRSIFEAFEQVAAGRDVAPAPARRVHRRSAEHARVHQLVADLTERERQTLHCLLRALDTTEIARSLGVAPSTARTHLQTVLMKLGVHTRLQAVAVVVAAGIDGEV
jgi:two-component system, NarL family, nitrate/nitrite response regulator NarL